jgi:hypothetical protein
MPPTSPQAVALCSASDLDSTQFIADVLNAHTIGLDVEDYLAARAYGISDAELHQVATPEFPLAPYAAARYAGASRAELAELIRIAPPRGQCRHRRKQTIGFTLYRTARAGGVTHHEYVDAVTNAVSLTGYVECRRAGASHAQVVEFNLTGGHLGGYAHARHLGASHAGLIEAVSLDIPEASYGRAIAQGIAHSELVEIAALAPDLVPDYVADRRLGYDHTTALATLQSFLAQAPQQ